MEVGRRCQKKSAKNGEAKKWGCGIALGIKAKEQGVESWRVR
jgi:hypothetical protein